MMWLGVVLHTTVNDLVGESHLRVTAAVTAAC